MTVSELIEKLKEFHPDCRVEIHYHNDEIEKMEYNSIEDVSREYDKVIIQGE